MASWNNNQTILRLPVRLHLGCLLKRSGFKGHNRRLADTPDPCALIRIVHGQRYLEVAFLFLPLRMQVYRPAGVPRRPQRPKAKRGLAGCRAAGAGAGIRGQNAAWR